MIVIRTLTTLAILLSLLAGSLISSATASEIELQARAVPSKNIVLLGDVAKIHNIRTAADKELASLELVPAPANGRTRSLRLREVQDLLALQGVKLVDHQFSGATSVQIGAAEIKPAGQTAPAQRIAKNVANQARTRVERAVVQHLQDHAESKATWNVALDLSPSQIELVAARTADVSIEGGSEPWTGEQEFTMTVRTAQGVSRIPVTASVSLPDRIVVARRAFRRGEVMQAADLDLQLPPPSSDTTGTFTRLEDVVGRETTHSIATGQPVTSDWVRNPVMVRRGEVVTVVAKASNVKVRTNARAVEDGGRGDVISVERLDNRQRFTARVIGVQELEVFVSSVSVNSK